MTVGSSYDIYSYTICCIVSRSNYRRSFVPLNSVDDCVIFSLGFENETNAKETLQQNQKRKTFNQRLFFFQGLLDAQRLWSKRKRNSFREFCSQSVMVPLYCIYHFEAIISIMSKNYITVLNEDIFKKLLQKCKYRIHIISNYGKVSRRK